MTAAPADIPVSAEAATVFVARAFERNRVAGTGAGELGAGPAVAEPNRPLAPKGAGWGSESNRAVCRPPRKSENDVAAPAGAVNGRPMTARMAEGSIFM